MYAEDSRKYSFCQSFRKKFLQKGDDHCIIPVTLQSFKPSREYRRFLLYRGLFFVAALTNLATDLNILWKANPAVKLGSFFDITRITWLYRHHTIRSFEMQKNQILGRFLAYNYSDTASENLFKFQNCDLRKFHDLPKIRNFCPPENVKFIFINKSFNFPHD